MRRDASGGFDQAGAEFWSPQGSPLRASPRNSDHEERPGDDPRPHSFLRAIGHAWPDHRSCLRPRVGNRAMAAKRVIPTSPSIRSQTIATPK